MAFQLLTEKKKKYYGQRIIGGVTIAYIISTAKHSQNIIQLAQYCILATTNYYIIYC